MHNSATILAAALHKHADWDTDAQAMRAWAESPEGIAFGQGAHDGVLALGQGAATAANDTATFGTGIGKAILGAPLAFGDRHATRRSPHSG